jgi:hypothetical protein
MEEIDKGKFLKELKRKTKERIYYFDNLDKRFSKALDVKTIEINIKLGIILKNYD